MTHACAKACVDKVLVSACRIPTDLPESDGTLQWDSTTLVLVELEGGGKSALGYTYGHQAIATLIHDKLAHVVVGRDIMDIAATHQALEVVIRNLGRAGLCAMAISALDIALWDLKARVMELPLATLLGACRDRVPVYGSGGFTSYDNDQLCEQLAGWVDAGIPRVKMKIGRDPARDPERMRVARAAIGPGPELFVDANGAHTAKQAVAAAGVFGELGINWYEEPVSSDDLDGLRHVREHLPPGVDVAAGEYGFTGDYFRRMLAAGAVDVLQADITRCRGVTGFLQAGALAAVHHTPLSAHCAPTAHVHACCAVEPFRHLEYFHDHVRIESMLFDGARQPEHGALAPNLSRPGLGVRFKHADAKPYLLQTNRNADGA